MSEWLPKRVLLFGINSNGVVRPGLPLPTEADQCGMYIHIEEVAEHTAVLEEKARKLAVEMGIIAEGGCPDDECWSIARIALREYEA